MIQVKYARASLSNPKSDQRRQLNLDFILEGSTNLNKVTFKLTNRHREYLANIDAIELAQWPKHNDIVQQAVDMRTTHPTWIGKGNKRVTYQKGITPPPERLLNTGAILIQAEDKYVLHAQIEDWLFDIALLPSEIARYAYIGEFHMASNVMTPKAVKGEWK
jgi:hypothetical protein